MVDAPSMQMLGEVAAHDARKRARGCGRHGRLIDETVRRRVNRATGEVAIVGRYRSSQELDGITYVRCGDRRAKQCESCSRGYKGDSWHLLMAGLQGGKDVPEAVATHPMTFATLTPPSFGPVHGVRQRVPCRARRDKPCCRHGRPLYCMHRRKPGDGCLGEPLCPHCYEAPKPRVEPEGQGRRAKRALRRRSQRPQSPPP
jgi:Replication initiator protein, pSAM2